MTTDGEGATTPPAADPIDESKIGRAPWVILGSAVAGGVILLILSLVFGPSPSLDSALRLAALGKTAEAEKALTSYIKHDPGDHRARVALADLLLNLSPPKAAHALEVLEPAQPPNLSGRAVVHVLRGKAYDALHRPARAEAEWTEALRLDPLVAEAGPLLLQLYYFQGRAQDSRRLALRLSDTEPDPRDRVRLLLAPMQFDAQPVAAAGVITLLKEAAAIDPGDRGAARAYFLALVRDGVGIDEGIKGLRELVRLNPDDPSCREALLKALEIGDTSGLENALTNLPVKLKNDPSMAVFRGIVANAKNQRDVAIREFETAVAADPSDKATLHRLAEAYKLAGRTADAESAKAREEEMEQARVELRGIKGREAGPSIGRPGLYDDMMNRPDLGLVPNPVLYRQVASLRERMGHTDEAIAWHKLILRDNPEDAGSLAALSRLQKAASATR